MGVRDSMMRHKQLIQRASLVAGSALAGAAVLFLVAYWSGYQVVSRDADETRPARTPNQVHTGPYPSLSPNPVHNVIVFIGDGMGLNQINLARLEYHGPAGRLHMERMPVTGLVTTHALDNLIPDSAAGATAMATGEKTRNYQVSVGARRKPLPTLLERAHDAGFSTALVTTTLLTDATTAAFASHVESRQQQDAIATQLLDSGVEILVGDLGHFFPHTDPRSRRADDLDLVGRAVTRGYTFVDSKARWAEAEGPKILAHFPGLMAGVGDSEFVFGQQGPSLAQIVDKSLRVLGGAGQRFIMVVEEEGTDTGGHINHAEFVTAHLNQLDLAVQVGVDFALTDRHTLVLVTSDHETGGLTFTEGTPPTRRVEVRWSTTGHTGQAVPLFALGPHAERFSGVHDNTEIPRLLAELLGLKNFATTRARNRE